MDSSRAYSGLRIEETRRLTWGDIGPNYCEGASYQARSEATDALYQSERYEA